MEGCSRKSQRLDEGVTVKAGGGGGFLEGDILLGIIVRNIYINRLSYYLFCET